MNEEKVGLRMLVMSMARTYRREEAQIGGKDTEQRFQTINDGRDSILSLIDRQPSEEEANDTWDRLKNITLKNGCDYPEYCDADNCSDFVECSVILEKIRKALNIEGKE